MMGRWRNTSELIIMRYLLRMQKDITSHRSLV